MNTKDWVILILVLLSLSLSIYSVVEMRRLRKRHYKEMLIGDLAEWATDFLLCVSGLDEVFQARKLGERSHEADLTAKWQAETEMLKTRIRYIRDISDMLGHRLHDHVADINMSMEKYCELVGQQLDGQVGEDKVVAHLANLNMALRKLLHEVTRPGASATR